MDEILEIAKNVLEIEGRELLRNSTLLDENFANSVLEILSCKGKVIVTGVGKSGLIGAKIAATFASTGTPSFFLHPTEGLHGDLGMIQSQDIILAISFSGESEELIKIVPHIKRYGAKIISLTKNTNSTLAKFSDIVIKTDILKEACPINAAPTTSTTITLALGDALAICLMKKRNFSANDFANFHPGGSLGKRLYTKIKDVMDKNLPLTNSDVSLKDAIVTMSEGKMGAVLLTDEKGILKAVLTDGDLRRAISSKNFDINESAIKYASKNPVSVANTNMLAIQALKIIKNHKIQILIVVDEIFKPIGVVSLHMLANLGILDEN